MRAHRSVLLILLPERSWFMHYIGSKRALIPFLQQAIFSTVGQKAGFVFADVFGGTGAVSRAFKPLAQRVITNDIETYSYTLLRHYIGTHRALSYQAHVDYLNALPGTTGFIAAHYGEGGYGRLYFSRENAQKIDAIRQQIGRWRQRGELDDDLYYLLLTSLLEAADRVANTTAVYAAYLKHLKPTARQPLLLRPPPVELTTAGHTVFNQDANTLIGHITGDVLYLDPPYNERQYGANYHLLNTIALYDAFTPQGKTGLRHYIRSRYCSRQTAASALEGLIRRADFEYVFLSYSNEGLLTPTEIADICSAYGSYHFTTAPHRRYRAGKPGDKRSAAETTTEYLHVLHKQGPVAQTHCLGLLKSTPPTTIPTYQKSQRTRVFGSDALPRGP
jgi:adenine-specific DNA-methyltransferase